MFLRSVTHIQTKEATLRWSIIFTEHQAAMTKVEFATFKLILQLSILAVRPSIPCADSLLDPIRNPSPLDYHPPARVSEHLLHSPASSLLQGKQSLHSSSPLTHLLHSWPRC